MEIDFEGLYEFHGHRCPMSTMGARMGVAAMRALGVTKADQFHVRGRYRAKNCALDGIQFTTGCTLGNGNLFFEDERSFVFELAMRDGTRAAEVTVSENALARLAVHKQKKAEYEVLKKTASAEQAAILDSETGRDFLDLVSWVQEAVDEELFHVGMR